MQEYGHVAFWVPKGEGCHEDPDYCDLVQELADQTEGGVEVDGPGPDHDEEDPHHIDAPRDLTRVLPEQVHQQRGHHEEQDITDLKPETGHY